MVKFKIEVDGKEKEITIIMSKRQLKALAFGVCVGLIFKQVKLNERIKSIAETSYLCGVNHALDCLSDIIK